MNQADELKKLIQEMDAVHPNGIVDVDKLDKEVLPTFETSQSGEQRNFTLKALSILRVLGRDIYKQSNKDELLKFDEYYTILKQAIADCHSDGTFDLGSTAMSDDDRLVEFKSLADRKISLLRTNFTHYFAAWTLGVETDGKPYQLGPVTFLTRNDWADSIQISEMLVNAMAGGWKFDLKGRLNGSSGTGIDDQLYDAVKSCPSVLKVQVSGSEITLSKMRARWACKSALDCLAILFNDAKLHSQFALQEDAIPPIRTYSLTETDNYLWLPGSQLRPRGWSGDSSVPSEITAHGQHLLSACGLAIGRVLGSNSHGAHSLAQRWCTALAWFGDGCREQNNAVAVAKLATSLDVLACGGKADGILKMAEHLYGVPANRIIAPETNSTLRDVVKEIYNYGRSQILHGNHVDPMRPFDTLRSHASTLTRTALRESVLAWSQYLGSDNQKAFRTIPRWQKPSVV
jgi:hypothetical protein